MSTSPNQSTPTSLVKFALPAIEGEEIRLDAQQIKPAGPPRPLKGLSGNYHHFTATTSARAELIKPYAGKDIKPKSCEGALTAVGSKIAGKKIAAFAKGFGKLTVGGDARSGKHPRQLIEFSSGALAVLTESSMGQTLPYDPRKLLQVTPVAVTAAIKTAVASDPPSKV